MLAFGISALGTVDLLALWHMRTDDTTEVRARSRARAARELANDAYGVVASARGHLGAAGRLYAATGIPNHAADDERVAVLEAIEGAARLLRGMEAWSTSDAPPSDLALPRRVDSGTRSAATAPSPVGARDGDAAWRSLGGAVPGSLLHVALSGALPDIEAAKAALLVGADLVDKVSKVHVDADADAVRSACYQDAFRALDAAHAELSALLALQSEAGVVFLRCAQQLGLDRGGQGWLSWEAARADAERHGGAALHHLWSASALLDYTFSGVLAWSSPTSAGQEARQLMGRALGDAGKARDAGDHLRHAAARGFLHMWTIVQSAQ